MIVVDLKLAPHQRGNELDLGTEINAIVGSSSNKEASRQTDRATSVMPTLDFVIKREGPHALEAIEHVPAETCVRPSEARNASPRRS